jgi:DNA-binding GntR family transcriptional regulator
MSNIQAGFAKMRQTAPSKTSKKTSAKKASASKAARRSAKSAPAKSASTTPGMSLREHAYQLIKHRIITCAFKPGENLNEAIVAEMLNLGRTPVNQAFDRLRLEALVDVMPRKGIVVRHIHFDEVLQISDARILNEAYAIRLAAERATTAEITAMRDVLAEATRLGDDLERFIMLDREFHMLIASAARNEVLSDILLNLNERSLRLWSISLADEAHKASVNNEHHEIFMAIFRRDPDEAERTMRRHIDSFRQTILKKLSDLQSDLGQPRTTPTAAQRKSLSLQK